ncbi:hypothetical protein [Amycolatopsis sp. NBC_00438]|uniref:hypothetical protein n=1 Tax=Amycolatopsis sp. NBC_00438 TaxID=2903558 RepID=UPI002E1CE02C
MVTVSLAQLDVGYQRRFNGGVVFAVAGTVDWATAAQLADAVFTAAPAVLVVDFGGLAEFSVNFDAENVESALTTGRRFCHRGQCFESVNSAEFSAGASKRCKDVADAVTCGGEQGSSHWPSTGSGTTSSTLSAAPACATTATRIKPSTAAPEMHDQRRQPTEVDNSWGMGSSRSALVSHQFLLGHSWAYRRRSGP